MGGKPGTSTQHSVQRLISITALFHPPEQTRLKSYRLEGLGLSNL